MKTARFLAFFLLLQFLGVAQETHMYVGHYLVSFPGPQVYRDSKSGTLLYVETDGRHVAAISRDGKLVWIRDPFTDAHLEFYRTEKPQIVYVGAASKADGFVAISFNNSQFGLLRISNGDFRFLGQD
jgi:hypothetical protein